MDAEINVPINFAIVEPGVYRSSFPRTKNISFLKRLGLKSVISLVLEEYPPQMVEFYQSNGIQLLTHGVDGNKGPFKTIESSVFSKIVVDVLNVRNRPILIHCNKGKHRTGCTIACLRRVRGWALSAVLNEYILFSHPKSRLEDQRYIESFNVSALPINEYGDIFENDSKESGK